jgi:hypothetical protein
LAAVSVLFLNFSTMKTLENKMLVYDDACPMCQAYTAGFIKMGWLERRAGFAEATPEMLAQLDLNRSRHEIPLLDTATGEVRYGLDALFLILGEHMPVFKPLFRNRFFRAPLYQLYQIITYNRRIIAGSVSAKTGFDCAPDVNVLYRWVYILLALSTGAWLLVPAALPAGWMGTSLLAFHGITLLAGLAVSKKLDYLGHWATIWLVNGLVFSIGSGIGWIAAALLLLSGWMWQRRWRTML